MQPEKGYAELQPPADLQKRLQELPQDYLYHGKVLDKFRFATTKDQGRRQLDAAIKGNGVNNSTWPQAHFLGPLHPVLDWVEDRALASLGRNQIFAIRGHVDAPQVLCMGTITNKRGQVISRAFYLAEELAPGMGMMTVEALPDLTQLVTTTGFAPGSPNPGPVANAAQYQPLIPLACQQVKPHMKHLFTLQRQQADARLQQWNERADEWQAAADDLNAVGSHRTLITSLGDRVREERHLADVLRPDKVDVRPLLVIVPDDTPTAGTSAEEEN